MVILLSLAVAGTGCVRQLRHDPALAASSAQKFVELLAVKGDVNGAYEMTDPASRHGRSAADLGKSVSSVPIGKLDDVAATEFQPVPGQPAIDIFLKGHNTDGKTIHFAVRVNGTADDGYAPASMAVAFEPFPASSMRRSLQ